jgi:hypothetical protein
MLVRCARTAQQAASYGEKKTHRPQTRIPVGERVHDRVEPPHVGITGPVDVEREDAGHLRRQAVRNVSVHVREHRAVRLLPYRHPDRGTGAGHRKRQAEDLVVGRPAVPGGRKALQEAGTRGERERSADRQLQGCHADGLRRGYDGSTQSREGRSQPAKSRVRAGITT